MEFQKRTLDRLDQVEREVFQRSQQLQGDLLEELQGNMLEGLNGWQSKEEEIEEVVLEEVGSSTDTSYPAACEKFLFAVAIITS